MDLCSLQIARGSVDQAIGGYQRALQANPRNVRLYVALGSILETRKEWQQAEGYYQKALQIEPDYPLAANNLAYVMLEHGENINVAVSLAQTGRRGLPNQPYTADTLGWAYYYQGVYEAAAGLFQEAIKADPKNPTYHYHLGMAYAKEHKFAQARQQLDATLQLSPNYENADQLRQSLAQNTVQN
jgi:Flp pilus assembly protein TadD